jgi:hypothetical protein
MRRKCEVREEGIIPILINNTTLAPFSPKYRKVKKGEPTQPVTVKKSEKCQICFGFWY